MSMFHIKGFYVDNIVEFRGHEGEPLQQGDLFLKNEDGGEDQKVGFLSDDAHGGPINYNFKSSRVEELYHQAAENFYDDRDNLYGPDDFLYEHLFELARIEKRLYNKFSHREVRELDLIFIFEEGDYGKYPVRDYGFADYNMQGFYKIPTPLSQKYVEENLKEEQYYTVISCWDFLSGEIKFRVKENENYEGEENE